MSSLHGQRQPPFRRLRIRGVLLRLLHGTQSTLLLLWMNREIGGCSGDRGKMACIRCSSTQPPDFDWLRTPPFITPLSATGARRGRSSITGTDFIITSGRLIRAAAPRALTVSFMGALPIPLDLLWIEATRTFPTMAGQFCSAHT